MNRNKSVTISVLKTDQFNNDISAQEKRIKYNLAVRKYKKKT